MEAETLRHALRTGTRDLHDSLDAKAGSLDSLDNYCLFLSASHALRAALEPSLTAGEGWPLLPILPELQADMRDLGLPVTGTVQQVRLDNAAARAGALYVLEGSAIGARLIQRRAAALGLSAEWGARHLARQTASRDRWPSFLTWLEEQPVPHAHAVLTARAVFSRALAAYRLEDAA